MARAQLTAQLSDFEAVVKKMRALGVASWADSPVGSIILGAAPERARTDKTEKDPRAAKRQYYSEVFNRPVYDAELENLP